MFANGCVGVSGLLGEFGTEWLMSKARFAFNYGRPACSRTGLGPASRGGGMLF